MSSSKHNHSHTEHGEAQRQNVVEAAYRLIAEQGLEGLRTREVAARADLNVATLHYYFATKEALIREVVAYQAQQFAAPSLPSPPAATEEPCEALRYELADLKHRLEQTPEIFIVQFELYLRSLRDPTIRDMLREMQSSWHHAVVSYLQSGIAQGIFRDDLEAGLAATSLMAFIQGIGIQALSDPTTFPLEQVFDEIERWLSG